MFSNDIMVAMGNEESQILIFETAGQLYGIVTKWVREIVHIPALVSLPGQPPVLAGFLNLRGNQVPVVRLRRLMNLDEKPFGVFTPLVVVDADGLLLALEVDAVEQVLTIPPGSIKPIDEGHSPNDCAEGAWSLDGRDVVLLSPKALLFEKERQCFAELQAVMQQRLGSLSGT